MNIIVLNILFMLVYYKYFIKYSFKLRNLILKNII